MMITYQMAKELYGFTMVLLKEVNNTAHDVLPPTVTRLPSRYPAVSVANPVRARDRAVLFRCRGGREGRDDQRRSHVHRYRNAGVHSLDSLGHLLRTARMSRIPT